LAGATFFVRVGSVDAIPTVIEGKRIKATTMPTLEGQRLRRLQAIGVLARIGTPGA
jgi:hypothetical protein